MSDAPNSWQKKCYVTITKKSGSNTEFGSKTADIDFGGAARTAEVIDVNTGQYPKLGRMQPFEITFKDAIPIYVSDWDNIYYGGTSSTQPIQVTASDTTDLFRLAILWTTQTGITSAAQGMTSGEYYRRLIYKDVYFIGNEDNWKDFELRGEKKFWVPALDSTGSGNLLIQSSLTSSTTLSALGNYTGGNFT